MLSPREIDKLYVSMVALVLEDGRIEVLNSITLNPFLSLPIIS